MTSDLQDILRNAIKMKIGEVLTCPGLTVSRAARATLPNDRRNTDRDILLSSSDDDDN